MTGRGCPSDPAKILFNRRLRLLNGYQKPLPPKPPRPPPPIVDWGMEST